MIELRGKESNEIVSEIRKDLREHHAEILQKAYSDPDYRSVLKDILQKDHAKTLDTEEKIEDVLRELVGLSFVEELVEKQPGITDIGFDGGKLIIEGNGFPKYSINSISETDIQKLIAKFSNTTGKELTPKDPILNTSKNHLRLNAVHNIIAKDGTTMAIRVSREYMALNEDNFSDFAPLYILDFFKAAIKTRSNIFIAGETGTGKTELQKLLISMIPFEERMAVIETNKDLYVKELFPEKDIFYWIASNGVSIGDLISWAGLRSHPIWIIVGEILSHEVYQMMLAVLSGHRTITTLHSVDARAIPQRVLSMAKEGYTIDEKMFLDNVYRYFQFGFHIKKRNKRRYLSEIVEYNANNTATTVFKQVETANGLKPEIGSLSKDFYQRLIEFQCDYKGLPIEEVIPL